MKLPCTISLCRRLCQESNSEEGNQLFKMANTDPNPLLHLSFEPNGLAQVSVIIKRHECAYHAQTPPTLMRRRVWYSSSNFWGFVQNSGKPIRIVPCDFVTSTLPDLQT